MNSHQRIWSGLRGEPVDAVPVMLHSFMMAAAEAGVTMQKFRSDPETIAGAFLRSVDRYGYDGIVVDIDTATLAGAVGVPVDFPRDEPARVKGALLHSLEDVRDLEPVDLLTYPGARIWLEAVRLVKERCGNEIFVRGNCDQAPFTLASLIRGMDGWMMDLLDPRNEELIHTMLDYCTGVTVQFIRLMAETGADMVSNGDSVAGPEIVSPSLFRRFALPYERQVVKASQELGLPYLLHICGNTGPILGDLTTTGATGLEIDYKTDARLACSIFEGRVTFVGNIDPSGVLARGTPALVREKTLELLNIFAGNPRFILNAGCAIPPHTPPENLQTMIRVAREFLPALRT
jgi:MtaA/CmuA family methyltransferase